MIFRFSITFLLMLLAGCTTIYHHEYDDDPRWAPSYPEEENKVNKSGSIYDEITAKMLFQDKKALRIGDIITVVLTENTSATKNADTNLTKDTGISTTETPALLVVMCPGRLELVQKILVLIYPAKMPLKQNLIQNKVICYRALLV
ncbi:MAG: flagellar basal body L-ring protein FlgH [Enterobacterales bacterium]|nr:flagellar basal body L-ring protein FlgH [Enterobacterales bacterium]